MVSSSFRGADTRAQTSRQQDAIISESSGRFRRSSPPNFPERLHERETRLRDAFRLVRLALRASMK